MIGNGWGETYYQGRIQASPPPANKIFKKFEEIFNRRESRGCARRVTGGGKGIANCELRIADLQPPAGCDLFRVQKLGRRPSMQSVCCASAPFSKSTSFQLRLVLDRVLF